MMTILDSRTQAVTLCHHCDDNDVHAFEEVLWAIFNSVYKMFIAVIIVHARNHKEMQRINNKFNFFSLYCANFMFSQNKLEDW
jgi:hypothetical protein